MRKSLKRFFAIVLSISMIANAGVTAFAMSDESVLDAYNNNISVAESVPAFATVVQ